MPHISRIDVYTAHLPFRISFGHALAERRSSTNVYTRVRLDDGSVGYGEGVPREYVTGETVEGAVQALTERFVPAILQRGAANVDEVPRLLEEVARSTSRSDGLLDCAAWCALELAVLDAFGKSFGCSVARWLGGAASPTVHYDAIIPFVSQKTLPFIATAVRALGFRHVKIKVGDDLQRDVRSLRVLRRVLGPSIDIRVDANCAWNLDQAMHAIGEMRKYRISSVEQPLPADDLDGLRKLTAETPEMIIVDESLRTVGDALRLAQMRACDAFNIRVSKCGGLLQSLRIAEIAEEAGMACVVGAQVGESGLLSAAGRHLAASLRDVRYVEGSAGRLLLKDDLTVENVLPGLGGRAKSFTAPGLGVRVRPELLERYGVQQRQPARDQVRP